MPPHLEPLHKALAELESDSGALALVRSGFLRFMESVIQAHETSEPVNPPRIPWPLPDRALGGDEAAYLLATLHDALVIDGPRLARLDREPASPGRSFALAILEKQRLDFTATVESPERRPVLRGDVARLSGLIVRVSLSKPGGAGDGNTTRIAQALRGVADEVERRSADEGFDWMRRREPEQDAFDLAVRAMEAGCFSRADCNGLVACLSTSDGVKVVQPAISTSGGGVPGVIRLPWTRIAAALEQAGLLAPTVGDDPHGHRRFVAAVRAVARLAEETAPKEPAGGGGNSRFLPARSFGTKLGARLRMAAGPNRKGMKVRCRTIEGTKCYSVDDARKWWPTDVPKEL